MGKSVCAPVMPLLTELGLLGDRFSYKHVAPTGALCLSARFSTEPFCIWNPCSHAPMAHPCYSLGKLQTRIPLMSACRDYLPRCHRVTNAVPKAAILYAQSPSKFEGLVACK
jgi:hypothetical protein